MLVATDAVDGGRGGCGPGLRGSRWSWTRVELATLRASRTIVTAQLLSDIDNIGYYAVGVFLGFFVEHCDGMVQADGEGFYEGDRPIVELK